MGADSANTSRLRVLVVGVGFMGRLHATVVRDSRLAVLCGVVDRDERVAREVGRQFGALAFTDVAHAMEETQPDAAIVATPDPTHRAPAEKLLDAGVPVLVEKPLATNLEDALAITDLAETRNVPLMVGHTTRFLPRYIKAVEAVRSGQLGKPVMVITSTWGPKSLGARVAQTTNPLWHFAIHDIDLIQWVSGGVIDEVYGAQMVDSPSGVSLFAATGILTGETSFHLSTGWTLPDSASPRWDLKIHCEEGLIQAMWSTDGVTIYKTGGIHEVDCYLWPTLYGRIEGSLKYQDDHFLQSVLDDTPFVIRPQQALAAVRSAATLELATTRHTQEGPVRYPR